MGQVIISLEAVGNLFPAVVRCVEEYILDLHNNDGGYLSVALMKTCACQPPTKELSQYAVGSFMFGQIVIEDL